MDIEPKRYRSKYLIQASATPLTDGPGFSVTAWVTYPEDKRENDLPFTLEKTDFKSIEEAEAAGMAVAAAHVDQLKSERVNGIAHGSQVY
jgi:hypothetical protein